MRCIFEGGRGTYRCKLLTTSRRKKRQIAPSCEIETTSGNVERRCRRRQKPHPERTRYSLSAASEENVTIFTTGKEKKQPLRRGKSEELQQRERVVLEGRESCKARRVSAPELSSVQLAKGGRNPAVAIVQRRSRAEGRRGAKSFPAALPGRILGGAYPDEEKRA